MFYMLIMPSCQTSGELKKLSKIWNVSNIYLIYMSINL
jgi:hypothetical protein